MPGTRCINIDWLECYCLESQPRTAEYFAACGFEVSIRAYGTRFYQEMFTLYQNGEAVIEVRRAPSSVGSVAAARYFDPRSCHIRLCNRTCYAYDAATIMQRFLDEHGFVFQSISRIDLCLDFEKFDSGDDPFKFLTRYLKGRYAKVNQCTIAVHGKDEWDGRNYNSVSWGSKKSPVFTRFYDKTLELKEGKDKPYIRQAWASCGLVDDFIKLTKKGADGVVYKPRIWRLEFAIQSSVKNWVCFDVDEMGNSTHRSKRNELSVYANRDLLEPMFSSLVSHYFHFKYFTEGQRKDRCPDKVLFDFTEKATTYKVEKICTAKSDDSHLRALQAKIEAYRMLHFDEGIRKACDVILHSIAREILNKQASNPLDETEVLLLQRLIADAVNHPGRPIDLDFYRNLMDISDSIF